MPQISPEFLIRSLQKLTNTQDDMQSLALFIRLNKTEHELMTNIYRRELEKSNIYHKLTLYYLANEIIQTERDTDNDSINLVNGIRKCVVDTFKHVDVAGDLKLNFDKLKSVWLKRKIFEEYEIGSSGEKTETNKFGREEFISRVNKYFDCQEEFVSYLTEFVDHINKK